MKQQVTTQTRKETPTLAMSKLLRHTAVRGAPQHEMGPNALPQTRFEHNFSRVPVRTGAPMMIQAKLTISEPGDKYEKEAERVADLVMRMPDPRLRRRVEPDEEEQLIQTKPVEGQAARLGPNLETEALPLGGGGRPLSRSMRDFFEPRFGHDFSQVRIHTGDRAAAQARALSARAFTVGRDIVFGAGHLAEETAQGKRLLAHELTHVVQQSPPAAGSSGISRNVSSLPEARISRWKIRDSIATVTKKGDTLWALARRITGDGRDWHFIRPVAMQSPKAETPKYWLHLRIGDTFDVSELLAGEEGKEKLEGRKTVKKERVKGPVLEEEDFSVRDWESLTAAKKAEIVLGLTPEEEETFKTPEGPVLKMLVKPWGIDVDDIPPEMTAEEIWDLVLSDWVWGVSITDEVRKSKEYMKLWNENFFYFGFPEVLKVAPISIAETPFGKLFESLLALVEPKDRPTKERLLQKITDRTDLEAKYYIILNRLGKRSPGAWSATLRPLD